MLGAPLIVYCEKQSGALTVGRQHVDQHTLVADSDHFLIIGLKIQNSITGKGIIPGGRQQA